MHYYQYLHDPEFVIESETPRDDLLEWAYWSEIPAPAVKAKSAPEPAIEAEPVAESAPEPKPAAKKAAPRKAATPKAVEGE